MAAIDLPSFIVDMPKVELHVHLEGSIRPETLLALAKRYDVTLPASDVEGLRRWYTFTDFDHFIEIYMTFAQVLRSAEDIELVAREFLAGQARQNIRYSEVTYTPYSQYEATGIPFHEQLAALNRAREWAARELDTHCAWVMDIARNTSPDEGLIVADWATGAMGEGVCALGLGGPEIGNPPEKFAAAFERAHAAGLPAVPHAGETEGPSSIWGALEALHAVRIGHGVRCLEDPRLVEVLRERRVPLEVCPTSNVCLKVARDFSSHPFPRLLQEGLVVTLNSDDPPMFNTTLTDEYRQVAEAFGLDSAALARLAITALDVSLLPQERKMSLRAEMERWFAEHIDR